MTADRALELSEALFHELRNGNRPYVPTDEIDEILEALSVLRETTKGPVQMTEPRILAEVRQGLSKFQQWLGSR